MVLGEEHSNPRRAPGSAAALDAETRNTVRVRTQRQRPQTVFRLRGILADDGADGVAVLFFTTVVAMLIVPF